MHILRTGLVAAATVIATLPASAADSICPETVSVTQSGVAPPGWSVSSNRTPIQLEMVTFYNGPPKDEASLVYDDLVTAKDSSTIATWNFPRDPRGYWVKCSYRGTTQELSKALPPTVSSCRVTYNREAGLPSGLPAIRRIVCQ